MIENPFTTVAFPTFEDIPLEFRRTFANKFRKRDGKLDKKYRMMKFMWIAYFGNHCPSCTAKMTTKISKSGKKNFMTIDHVLARGLGGDSQAERNLTCICRECNGFKSAHESKISMMLWCGVSRKAA